MKASPALQHSSCREALYQGDKDQILQILVWLFSQQQQQPGLLHKRAFVGYYLGGIDVSAGPDMLLHLAAYSLELQKYLHAQHLRL